MTKTAKIIIGVIVVIIVIGGIWYGVSRKPAQVGEKEPIKIGGIFALTGLGASQGEQELRGVNLAVEQINQAGGVNGRLISLVIEDVSLDKLQTAASAASKLINIDKVVAIIGTTWDEPAQVILPIIEDAKIPTVGQNQTRTLENEKSFNYFFSTWYNNEVGVKILLSFAENKGWNKIAIMRPVAGGFYQYVSDLVEKNSNQFNIQIVENINLNNPGIIDFRTDLARVKYKNPDAILIVLNGFTECTFLKQVKELGLNIPILSTEAAGDFPSLQQCPDLMENLYFSYPKETKSYKEFAESYHKMFDVYPETPSVMTAYDALKIIVEALKETNGIGGEILRDTISKTQNFAGVSLENISFDEIGFVETPVDAFEMRTVKNDKFVSIGE